GRLRACRRDEALVRTIRGCFAPNADLFHPGTFASKRRLDRRRQLCSWDPAGQLAEKRESRCRYSPACHSSAGSRGLANKECKRRDRAYREIRERGDPREEPPDPAFALRHSQLDPGRRKDRMREV